jgi:hypothetical protein
LAVHVDDTLGGGTLKFHALMNDVALNLKVGSKETGTFHYKGLRVTTIQTNDVFEIVVDGDEYLDSTVPMVLPSGLHDDAMLPPADITNYRSVAECIGYRASAFRPDLALEASLLGRSFVTPTVRNARKANSVLEWAKIHRYNLNFRRCAVSLIAFSDSAGRNDESTQGGRLFVLANEDRHKVAGWIHWESRKVKRVCRSTTTGETLSLGESYDTSMWLSQIWSELTGRKLKVRLVVDSMGSMKNVLTTKLPVEKRLRIDLACIRQGLRNGDFEITWVPSRANLSDPLRKESESDTARLKPCTLCEGAQAVLVSKVIKWFKRWENGLVWRHPITG